MGTVTFRQIGGEEQSYTYQPLWSVVYDKPARTIRVTGPSPRDPRNIVEKGILYDVIEFERLADR
jgi:hypothetical protein